MGNGLLAEWRRGIFARGLAGAALVAVPVTVAAAIGFGTSFSGLTGGLSELASGPADSGTATPRAPAGRVLDRTLISLSGAPSDGGGGSGTGGGGGDRGDTGTVVESPGGTGGGTGTGGGNGGGNGGNAGSNGGSSGLPGVTLPGGGGGGPVGGTGGDSGDPVGDIINGTPAGGLLP